MKQMIVTATNGTHVSGVFIQIINGTVIIDNTWSIAVCDVKSIEVYEGEEEDD